MPEQQKDYTFKTNSRSGYTSNPNTGGGNILVRNIGLNPLVNFNFMLRVEGYIDVPCKSVGAFTKENEFEYIKEGGLNDYVHMKRKQITKPFTFTVERYVGLDYFDPLPLGGELILPVLLFVSRFGNKFDVVERAYTFTGCTVISKEYGRLDAEKSGLLTENVTIAYRELLVVDTPGDVDLDLTEFDGEYREPENTIYNMNEMRKKDMRDADFRDVFRFSDADLVPHRSMQEHLGLKEKDQDDMEAAAKKYNKYVFKKTNTFRQDKKDGEELPSGAVEGHALYNVGEYRKSKMEEEADLYKFDGKPFRSMEKQKGRESDSEEKMKKKAKLYKWKLDEKTPNKENVRANTNADEVRKADMKTKYDYSAEYKWDNGSYKANNVNVRKLPAPDAAVKTGAPEKKSFQAEYKWDNGDYKANKVNVRKLPAPTATAQTGAPEKKSFQAEYKFDTGNHTANTTNVRKLPAPERTPNTGGPEKKSFQAEYKWNDGSYNPNKQTKRALSAPDAPELTGKPEKKSFVAKYDWEGKDKKGNKTPVRAMKDNNAATTTAKQSFTAEYKFDKKSKPVRTMEKAKNMKSASADEMKKKAEVYEFAGTDKKGNTERLRSTPAPNEKTHPTPRIWQPVKK